MITKTRKAWIAPSVLSIMLSIGYIIHRTCPSFNLDNWGSALCPKVSLLYLLVIITTSRLHYYTKSIYTSAAIVYLELFGRAVVEIVDALVNGQCHKVVMRVLQKHSRVTNFETGRRKKER